MSWIFGVISKNLPLETIKKLTNIHAKPIHKIETTNIYIAAGGIKPTCYFGNFSESSGWFVVGLGIKKKPRVFDFKPQPIGNRFYQ